MLSEFHFQAMYTVNFIALQETKFEVYIQHKHTVAVHVSREDDQKRSTRKIFLRSLRLSVKKVSSNTSMIHDPFERCRFSKAQDPPRAV